MAEATDAQLWRGVEVTVRDVLLPAITDEWARAAAVQLVGLARYAARRPPDPTAARVVELANVLDHLHANELVAAAWNGERSDPLGVFCAVGRVLASAVDLDGPDADQVRAELRTVVVRHLDDDLAVTGPLVDAFRGNLDA